MSDELKGKNNPKDIGGDTDPTKQPDNQTPKETLVAPNTPSKVALNPQSKKKKNLKYYWKKTEASFGFDKKSVGSTV